MHSWCCSRGARTGVAAHRGWAGGLAVAELELEATHAYALIMSLGSS